MSGRSVRTRRRTGGAFTCGDVLAGAERSCRKVAGPHSARTAVGEEGLVSHRLSAFIPAFDCRCFAVHRPRMSVVRRILTA